jgi:hypothetical protein
VYKRGEIMKIFKLNLLLIVIISIISGCFGKSQKMLNQNNNDIIKAKTIAVLPVENKNEDSTAAQLLRSRLFEELYFKGYSKLSLQEIDKKLGSLYVNTKEKKKSSVAPQVLKDAVGADAGMYCTLSEDKKSKFFYGPVKIAVSCELRSTETGKTVWNAESESVRRNFDFTNKGLEKKSHEDLEAVIDEVINKILKTLPDGPNLRS